MATQKVRAPLRNVNAVGVLVPGLQFVDDAPPGLVGGSRLCPFSHSNNVVDSLYLSPIQQSGCPSTTTSGSPRPRHVAVSKSICCCSVRLSSFSRSTVANVVPNCSSQNVPADCHEICVPKSTNTNGFVSSLYTLLPSGVGGIDGGSVGGPEVVVVNCIRRRVLSQSSDTADCN